MSTYLLLRNNKESGPYTIEEIRQLSLKSYDLVWVEGKSAAWRYPGEIPEFNSFAPPVPEQPFDRFYKKTPASITPADTKPVEQESRANTVLHSSLSIKDEIYHQAEINTRRDNKKESETALSEAVVNKVKDTVYINLPASEKKAAPVLIMDLPARKNIDLNWEEPERNTAQALPASSNKSSVKGLLIGSIILFFGAGLATGFYISNRRIFYTGNGNPAQQFAKPFPKPDNTGLTGISHSEVPPPIAADNKKITTASAGQPGPGVSRSKKKAIISAVEKKDSVAAAAISQQAAAAADSARKKAEADSQLQALAAKIKAHPEEYLIITTGNYKTGVLGGLSEIPVSITNRAGVPIDLAVVAVDYVLHNRKVFKTENLSFHDLAPGSTTTLQAPKSPRGVKITYRLTIANAQQIGMSYSLQ